MAIPIIYADIETDNTEGRGLDVFRSKVVTLQMMNEAGKVTVLKDPEDLDKTKDLLENSLVVGHNISFDSKFLKYHYDANLRNVYDTQIAEILISGGLYAGKRGVTGLKDVVLRRFGVEMDKHEQTGFQWGVPLTKAQLQYAADDLKYLPLIYKEQQKEIKRLHLEEVVDIEMKAIPAMVWLYLSGISFDADKLEALKVDLLIKKRKSEATLLRAFGTSKVNFASPMQLKKALAGIGIDVENASVDSIKAARMRANKGYKATGRRAKQSTLFEDAEEELSAVDVLDGITDYKESGKLLNTFVGKLPSYVNPKTGRVHADYRQLGAKSGRMSCSNPNMQQQPSKKLKGWRSIFTVPDGKAMVVADYSQAELRILTELSKDENFINAYQNNLDMHTLTASKVFHVPFSEVSTEDRGKAKALNFGLVYGISGMGLQRNLKTQNGIEISDEEAENIIKEYYAAYPGIDRYLKTVGSEGLRDLKVRTMAGRLCKFEYPRDEAEQRSMVRLAKNLPIQGLCADMVKLALGNLVARLEPMGVKLCAVVHDEIVLETDIGKAEEVKAILEEEMNKAGTRYIKCIPFYAEGKISDHWEH